MFLIDEIFFEKKIIEEYPHLYKAIDVTFFEQCETSYKYQ